jgi:hypothetical protein
VTSARFSKTGGLGHRRAGLMAGGRRRPCQGQCHNAFGHPWAQRRNARGPRLIAPKPRHAFLAEPFLPAPDHRLGLAGGQHDLGGAMSIGSSLARRAFAGCCGWPPPPQAPSGRRHSIECWFAHAFLTLAHASLPENPQANRNVRFGPLEWEANVAIIASVEQAE